MLCTGVPWMNGQSTGYLLLIRNEGDHVVLCLHFRDRMLIIYQHLFFWHILVNHETRVHVYWTYCSIISCSIRRLDYHVRAIPAVTLQIFILHFRILLYILRVDRMFFLLYVVLDYLCKYAS